MIDKLMVFNINNRNKIFLKVGVISILLIILISVMQINPQNVKLNNQKLVIGTAVSVDYTIVYDVASNAFYKNSVAAENALTATECTGIGIANSENGAKIIFDGVNITSTTEKAFEIIGDATIELTENSVNSITCNSAGMDKIAVESNYVLNISGTGKLILNVGENGIDEGSNNVHVYGIHANTLKINSGEIEINMPNINKTNGYYYGVNTSGDMRIDNGGKLNVVANGNSSSMFGISCSGNLTNYGNISIQQIDNNIGTSKGIYVGGIAYLGKADAEVAKIDVNMKGCLNTNGIFAKNGLEINNSQIDVNINITGKGIGLGTLGTAVNITNNSRVISVNNGISDESSYSCGIGCSSISIKNSFVETKNINTADIGGVGISTGTISIDGGKVIAAGGSGCFEGIATSNVTLVNGTEYKTQVLAAFNDVAGKEIVTYDSAQLGSYKNIIIGGVYDYGLRFDSSTGVMSKVNLQGNEIGTLTEKDLQGWTTKEVKNEEGIVESYILVLQGLNYISSYDYSLVFTKSTIVELKDETVNCIGNKYIANYEDESAGCISTYYSGSNSVDLKFISNTGKLNLEVYSNIISGEIEGIYSEKDLILDGGEISVYSRTNSVTNSELYAMDAYGDIKIQNNCKLNMDVVSGESGYLICSYGTGKVIFDNTIINIDYRANVGGNYVIYGETGIVVKNGSDIRINGEFLDGTVVTTTEDNKEYKYQQYIMMAYGDVNISDSKVYMDYDAYYAASIIAFDGNTNISNADIDIIARADDIEGISAYYNNSIDTTNIGKVNIDVGSDKKSDIYMKFEPMSDGTNGVESYAYGVISNCNGVNIEGTTIKADMTSNFYYEVIASISSDIVLKNINLDMKGKALECDGVYSYGGNIEITGCTIDVKDIKSDCFYGIYTYEEYEPSKTEYKGDITIKSSELNIKAEQITENSEAGGIWSEWGNINIQDNSRIDVYINAKKMYGVEACEKEVRIELSKVNLEAYSDVTDGVACMIYSCNNKINIDNSNVDINVICDYCTAIGTWSNVEDDVVIINSNVNMNINNWGDEGQAIYACDKVKVTGGNLFINMSGNGGDAIYSDADIKLDSCIMIINVNNSVSYGLEAYATISISGGTTIIRANKQALNKAPILDTSDPNFGVILASTDYNGTVLTGYNASNISTYKYMVIGQTEPYELKYYPSSGEMYANSSDTPLTEEELATRGITIDENKSLVLNNVNMTTTQKVGLWVIGDVDIKLSNNSENSLVSEGNTESDYYGIKSIGNVTISGNGTINYSKTNAADNLNNYYGLYSEYDVTLEKGDLNVVASSTSTKGNIYGVYAYNTQVKGGNTNISVSANNSMSYGIKCVGNYESIAGSVSIVMDKLVANTNGVVCDNDINIKDGALEITAYNVMNKVPIIDEEYVSMIEATNRDNTSIRPAVSSDYASYNYVLIESNYYIMYKDGKIYKNGELKQELKHLPNWSVETDSNENKILKFDGFVFKTSNKYGLNCAENTNLELLANSKNYISTNYYVNKENEYSYVLLGCDVENKLGLYKDITINGTGALDLQFDTTGVNDTLLHYSYGIKANNFNIENADVNISGKGFLLRGLGVNGKVTIDKGNVDCTFTEKSIGASAIKADSGVVINNSEIDIRMSNITGSNLGHYYSGYGIDCGTGDIVIYNTTLVQNITDNIGYRIYGIYNKLGNISIDSSSITQNLNATGDVYGVYIDEATSGYNISINNTMGKDESECGVTSVINSTAGKGYWIYNNGEFSSYKNTLNGTISSEKQTYGLLIGKNIVINSCTFKNNITSTNEHACCIQSSTGNITINSTVTDLKGETVNNSIEYGGLVEGINSKVGNVKNTSGMLAILLKGYKGTGICTGDDYESGEATFDSSVNDASITFENKPYVSIDVKGKDDSSKMYGIKAYHQDKLNFNSCYLVDVKASTQALNSENIVFGEADETATLITAASTVYKDSDEDGTYTYSSGELIQYPGKNDAGYKYVKIGAIPSYYFQFDANTGKMTKVLKNGTTKDVTSMLPTGFEIKTVSGNKVLILEDLNFTTIGPYGLMMKGTKTNLEIKGNNIINSVQDSHTWLGSEYDTSTYGIYFWNDDNTMYGNGTLNLNKINTNYIEDNTDRVVYQAISQMNSGTNIDILGGTYIINSDKVDALVGIKSDYLNINNSNITINGKVTNQGYGMWIPTYSGEDKTILNIDSSTINMNIISENESSSVVGIWAYDYSIDTSQNKNVICTSSNIKMILSSGKVYGISAKVNNVVIKDMNNLEIDVQGKAGSSGTNNCYGIYVSKMLTMSNTTAVIASNSTSSNTSSIKNLADKCNIKGKVDASTTYLSGEVTEEQLETVIDINTNFTAYKYVKIIPSVISVDISWGDMDYTYDDGTWNPSTHNYDNVGWKADNNGNKITVTNNSNVPIDADISYNASESYSIFTGNIVNNTTDMQVISSPQQVLVGNTMNSYLILSGQPIGNMDKEIIGKVTVTIAE